MNFNSDKTVQSLVYLCGFECYIQQANVSIKFPCNYYVQWRTSNSKFFSKSERRNPTHDKVIFNESIRLTLQMIHDNARNQFLKRQTIIELFLNSKSRPGESKLVGRVNIEVSNIINHSAFALPTIFKLQFCSISATLVMNFRFLSKSLSLITAASLDRSSIAEYIAKSQSKPQINSQSLVLSKFKNQNFQDQRRNLEKNKLEEDKIEREQLQSELSILSESLLTNQDKVAKYQNIQEVYQYLNGNRFDKIKLRQFLILTEQKQENILYQIEQENPLEDQLQSQSHYNAEQQLIIQLAQAREEITHLTNLYQQQRQDFWYSESISGTLSQINAKIQDQKHILTSQIATLRKINEQLQRSSTSLNQKILFLENSKANLETQKAQLKDKNTLLQENQKKLLQSIEKLQDQIKKIGINKKHYYQLELKNQGLQLQIHLLEKRLKQTEETIIDYQKKFSQLQLLVQKLQQQNELCNQRIRQSQLTQIELRKKMGELDLQIFFLSNSVEQFEAQKIEGQLVARQKQSIIDSLLLQVKEAERKITQSYSVTAQQQMHEMLDSYFIKLQSNISNIEVEKNIKMEQKLLQKCQRLQQQCQKLKRVVETLTAKFQEQISENNELSHQLILAQEKESIYTEIIKKVQTQLKQIHISLHQKAQIVAQCQTENLLLKNQLKANNLIQKREKSRPWLSPPRVSLLQQSAKQEIMKESKVLAQNNLELVRKIKDLNEKIGSLVIRHNQTRKRLQSQVQNLKKQLMEANSHISSLQFESILNNDP